jgi:hypothetical protein
MAQVNQVSHEIKAADLRIGNFYMVNGETRVVTPEIIRNIMKGQKDFRKAIPITEEWLLNLGFESNPYQDRYEHSSGIIVECDKTKGITELWIERFPHIKHIHQIQNLHHALTGKELQLKAQ